jgi:AraC-like DNA-binding protein
VQRTTLEDMAVAPVGKYIAGATFVHFCATPRLWGVILWGRPDQSEAERLGRSLVIELGPPAEPHVSIVDASQIQGGDPTAFRMADGYIKRNRATLAQQVIKLALVRPAGLDGALVAGAYDVLTRPYPVSVFAEAREALAWLGAELDPALLVRMHAEASSTPQEVGALRALLDRHLDGMPIATAAKQLGMSERTLQRKLADTNTTFKDELADARVRAAKRMLVASDAPLTTIAFDVGCGSLQNFSALFRRRTGESPSAFRAKHKTT